MGTLFKIVVLGAIAAIIFSKRLRGSIFWAVVITYAIMVITVLWSSVF